MAEPAQLRKYGVMVDPEYVPPDSVDWRLGPDGLIHFVERGELATRCGRLDWRTWTQLEPGNPRGREVCPDCIGES